MQRDGSHLVSSYLQDCLANNLFDGGDSILDFNQARAAQRDHAALGRLPLDVDGRAAGEDELADVVVDDHDLDEADAPFVAAVVALLAAAALVDREGADLVLLEAEVQQRLRGHLARLLAVLADAA